MLAAALLNYMGQFVGQELSAANSVGDILITVEENVGAISKGSSVQALAQAGRLLVSVNAYAAEVGANALLHERSSVGIHGLASAQADPAGGGVTARAFS